MSNQTSIGLLERLRSGNDPDWNRFIDVYRPLLAQWLRRCDVMLDDAEDLLQEILAAVVKAIPEFQHNGHPGAFRRWLKGLTHHRVLNHYRARKRLPKAWTDLPEDASPMWVQSEYWQSGDWEAEHDQYVLASLMRQVRPDFSADTWLAFSRQVMELTPPREVAVELGMTVGAVIAAKARVMRRLREESIGLVDQR